MKKLFAILLALAMIICMAACSGDAGQPKPDPAGTDGPTYGGTFRFGMFYVTPTFFTPKAVGSVKMFVTPSIEPVARLNNDGTVTPFLAESIETSKDDLTMTIKLREGIKFHDGSELTAEVLKWNLDTALEYGKASNLSNPKSIEIVDTHTVKITYSDWSVSWPNDMCDVLVYSKQAFDEHDADWCAVNMIGTGPFVMDSYTVDDRIVWSKNTNYWQDGLPYLDGVELVWIYDTTSSASAFMNKEIDSFDTSVAAAISMMVNNGFETAAADLTANCTYGFAIPNSANPDSPLHNVEVRKAILKGVDWKGVANATSGGFGYWSNQMGLSDAYSYDPNLKDTEYDLDGAKAMLAEAGYPDGFATTIWTITNNATNIACATALQAELVKMGIDAKVETVDTSVITDMRVNQSPDGFIVLGAGLSQDLTATLNAQYSPTGNFHTKMIAFSDEYLAALDAANKAATIEERSEALKTCLRLLTFDEVLVYPAFYIPKQMFTQPYVHDSGMNAVNAFQWTPECLYMDAH